MLYIFSFDRSGKNSTTPFVWSKHSLKKYFRCHICSKRNPPMYVQNSYYVESKGGGAENCPSFQALLVSKANVGKVSFCTLTLV